MLSGYAPTFTASRKKNDAFFAILQDALSTIPSNESYVVLGDFNALVDAKGIDDEWWYERGPHGYGA